MASKVEKYWNKPLVRNRACYPNGLVRSNGRYPNGEVSSGYDGLIEVHHWFGVQGPYTHLVTDRKTAKLIANRILQCLKETG